jgi:hypothetical protein
MPRISPFSRLAQLLANRAQHCPDARQFRRRDLEEPGETPGLPAGVPILFCWLLMLRIIPPKRSVSQVLLLNNLTLLT